MSDNGERRHDGRPAEARAEDLMERVVSEGSRGLSRLLGRAREEAEDILAEARTLNERWRSASHE